MQKYCGGQSAREVNSTLKSALKDMEEAKKCALLCFGEILERKLYRELGYSSINQYAKVELGFSKAHTGDFLNLCRRLKDLPEVKEQIEEGKLGYTHARTLLPVLDQTNQGEWLALAGKFSRRELEKEVKKAKRAASDEAKHQVPLIEDTKKAPRAVVPVPVNLQLSPTQFARYEALWEKLRKQGGLPPDKVEALLELMAIHTEKRSSREDLAPAVQIHIHQCPACEKASVQTSRGELEIGARELGRAQCDCQTSQAGERNRTAIPPKTRREVFSQHRHKCARAGCGHTRYLEIHHVVPRVKGGTNAIENLTCLCAACHSLVHDFGVQELMVPYYYGSNTRELENRQSRDERARGSCESSPRAGLFQDRTGRVWRGR